MENIKGIEEYSFKDFGLFLEKFRKDYFDQNTIEDYRKVIEKYRQKHILMHKITDFDSKEFVIDVFEYEGSIRLQVKNLYTACILFGHYIPSGEINNHIKGNYLHIPMTDYKIRYLNGMCWLIEDDGEECRVYTCFGKEKEVELVEWVRNGYLYEKEIDRVMKEFEEINPGVPYGSVEIEKGKNYEGMVDGHFSIKNINRKIWFIPGMCSFGGLDEI